jgi:hypothetical protein
VIKIGLYTTIELDMAQLMALSDSLQHIREAWMDQELRTRVQALGAAYTPTIALTKG